MATAAEILNHKLTTVVLTTTIVGVLLGYMDSRHASAMDVQKLTTAVQSSEVSRIEFQLDDVSRRYKRLIRIPEDERQQWEKEDIVDLEVRKEFLLRQLKRLEGK